MELEIQKIIKTAQESLKIAEEKDLQVILAKFIGRKARLTEILKSLGSLDLAKRKEIGDLANKAKLQIEEFANHRKKELALTQQEIFKQRDVTIPGFKPTIGHLSPITLITRELITVLAELGFEIADGPEAELELYNFDLLNIPSEHPARDEWDTFWLKKGKTSKDSVLLRTHTSPVQIRYMLNNKPPIRIMVPGRTFRYEAEDATHAAAFYQMEGLMIDKDISVANLKAVIIHFVRRILGGDYKVRFRPSFFPFTEPSFEVDVLFRDKWLELMGCGMVHPKVLRNVGIDPKEYSGFAFGIGVERLAMLKYDISDIRLFLNGDLRFIEQF